MMTLVSPREGEGGGLNGGGIALEGKEMSLEVLYFGVRSGLVEVIYSCVSLCGEWYLQYNEVRKVDSHFRVWMAGTPRNLGVI